MPRAIEELRAKLQQSEESGWKRRIQPNNNPTEELRLLSKNKYNDELSKSILETRKDELDASARRWKTRVEKPDAEEFSVAGKMEKDQEDANLPINIPTAEHKTPHAKRFKGKEDSFSSTPSSPEKTSHLELTRSYSVPEGQPDLTVFNASSQPIPHKVTVLKPDDDTFKSFFRSIESKTITTEQVQVSSDDLNSVTRQSLLVQKKNVQVQKRRIISKNPVKALAARSDIADEYTEVLTGVAEREKKRLNIEKLAKTSNLAHAAIAGLVSEENFKAVALKKPTPSSLYKPVMLLQVKGRQHVQTRLVEPASSSINEGDCYLLVTGNALYMYSGKYSNVIEQSRVATIANHVAASGDLGCKASEVVTLQCGSREGFKGFLEVLGDEKAEAFTDGGNPEEDGIYESNIISTNMIYQLEGSELAPLQEYWGRVPTVEMLQQDKVIVFDFGSEMYVWSGKNAPMERKKLTFQLAKQMWDSEYDYSACNVCPLNVAQILGKRDLAGDVKKKGSGRPAWALFTRITQHRETILFKEKFLDWPDFSRVIRVKGDQNEKTADVSFNISPCDVATMSQSIFKPPDLVVENQHLGRGGSYLCEETSRLYEFETLDVCVWRIADNQPQELSREEVGNFWSGDSYVVKWNYRTTQKGRELGGKPSKHFQAGRDRCIYFCWQGNEATINEKGSAALLTVELDQEKAPQIRVLQGLEPAAFLRIFNGGMIVHKGEKEDSSVRKTRLYLPRGELPEEFHLTEILPEAESLRSRTSLLLVQPHATKITVWHGCKSSNHLQTLTKQAAETISRNSSSGQFPWTKGSIDVEEIKEGAEGDDWWKTLGGGQREDYFSLLDSDSKWDFTMRMFHLSSITNKFEAVEGHCAHRSEEFSSPFPFLQSELYSASQPALFLIDNHHELYLWQGRWPERENLDSDSTISDRIGSGTVRFQEERRAALKTAVAYWRHTRGGDATAHVIHAGAEPLEFKALFPFWTEISTSAVNIEVRREVEAELALLSRDTYPLQVLLQRPLPDGVNPTQLEEYLSGEEFEKVLGMDREEFQKLPLWKQTALKKERGLF